MLLPVIINIDSRFDWTGEVRKLWEDLDWSRLKDDMGFPLLGELNKDDWEERRNQIVLIGLCSSLMIERAYGWDMDDSDSNNPSNDNNNERRTREAESWKKRQMTSPERQNSNDCREKKRFNGEEPHFHPPKTGTKGVVECYGIYVDNWGSFLGDEVRKAIGGKGVAELHGVKVESWSVELKEKKNPPLPEGTAILLCPERIVEIYPTLMTLGEKFRRPLPLSFNPALTDLKMVLLHELGHHFFPVSRSGAGVYVSEAFANRFCRAGLEEWEEPWLLYKTWHLQPPEYSAYRFLNLIEHECGMAASKAIASAFHGGVDGWKDVFKEHIDIYRTLKLQIMAIAIDIPPVKGFLDDLRDLGKIKRSDHYLEGIHLHHRCNEDSFPADLLIDLYEQNDITPWATTLGLPNRFWCSWGCSGTSWPEDSFHIDDSAAGKWIELYHLTPYPWLAETVRKKLTALKSDSPVKDYISKIIDDPDCCPKYRDIEEAILTIKWMQAMVEPNITHDKELTLVRLSEKEDALYRSTTSSLESESHVGERWIEPLVRFANKDFSGQIDGYRKTYGRRTYAISLLRHIPGFRPRPALNVALDSAIDTIRDATDWHHRVLAIKFVEACLDSCALPALEIAAVTAKGYAPPVRKAATEAIATLRATKNGR